MSRPKPAEILINTGNISLEGILHVPEGSTSLIIFSHGSGSSRFSPRNTFVSNELNRHGLSTLLVDLLTSSEDSIYENRFNIELLTNRLIAVTDYFVKNENPRFHAIGYFGASTGAASALLAARELKESIMAVVSRGGRPDLAMGGLPAVEAPTLLIVGSDDLQVLELNKLAFNRLTCEKKLQVISGATHLFEEPGAMEQVVYYASKWFIMHLSKIHT